MLGLNIADASKGIQLGSPGPLDRTIPGEPTGSARLLGYINADGTGWYSLDMTEYANGEALLSGRQVGELLQVGNGAQDFVTRLSFHDLQIRTMDVDATYRGSMTLRSPPLSSPTGPVTAAGSVSVRVNASGSVLLADDVSLMRKPVSGGYELSGTARIFDSMLGWIDLAFEKPWSFRDGAAHPRFGGALVGATESGAALRLIPLTPQIVSLQYASSATSVMDRAARVQWRTSFEFQTTRSTISWPAADAGPSRSFATGTEATLTGAFSSHPQTQFLRFHWALVFRPPGSAAALDEASAVQPRIMLDSPGRYLLRLEVDDGTRRSVDFVAVTAEASIVQPAGDSAQLPPGTQVQLGATVPIDMSLSPSSSLSDLGSSVELRVLAPRGDTAPIVNGTFVAAERGTFRVMLGPLSSAGYGPIDEQFIGVQHDVRFAPSVWFPSEGRIRSITVGDLNGDGRTDLLLSEDAQIEVFFGAPAPDLAGPIRVVGTTGGPVAVGDVTGDSRPDVATLVDGGVQIFEQQTDGQFLPGRLLASTCGTLGELTIADINGDGLRDIVAKCFTGIVYQLQTSGGGFDVERAGPTGFDSSAEFTVGDLNGDGIGDLVIASRHPQSPGTPNTAVIHGQPGVVMAAPVFVGPSAPHFRTPGVAVADVSGDGRDDLVITEAAFSALTTDPDVVRVFHQTSAGTLTESQLIALSNPRRAVRKVIIGDFDHDGRRDLGIQRISGSFEVLSQITPGRFGDMVGSALDCWADIVGDFNGDGLVDVACSLDGQRVMIMFGRPVLQ